MSFKRGFLKNILISGGYNYIAQGITFFSSFITARLLLPENYGIVGLITVFTGFISIFSDSGISLAVIKSDYGRTFHKALNSLATYIGIFLFILTSLLAYPISLFYKNFNLFFPTIVLATTFIFKCMAIVRGALLSKELKFAYLGKVLLISTTITVLLTIILAYLGAEYWAIIIPQVVSSIVTLFLYNIKLKLGYRFYPYNYLKVAFKQTKLIIGSLIGFNLINYWARNFDNLVVGKIYGVHDLGIYNRAYSLLALPLTLISGLVSAVLYPSLKRVNNSGGEINEEYFFVLKLITIISYPITLILVLFPEPLVSIIWGKNWLEVSRLLPYFGLLVFSQSLLSTTGSILVLKGKEKSLMFSGWVSAFFLIAGIWIGSRYQMIAIAQFYSLSFLIFVLPFNVVYIFIHSLKFKRLVIYFFWIPIILISLCIWVACYQNIGYLKYISLLLLLLIIMLNSRKEMHSLSGVFFHRIKQLRGKNIFNSFKVNH